MDFAKAIEAIKCISNGEYKLALLNLSGLSKDHDIKKQLTKEQTSFFENLDDILLQNQIDTPTRWSFECFLTRFGIHQGKVTNTITDFQIDSAIYEFEKISKKDKLLKNLKSFLFGQNIQVPSTISDRLALEFCREILYIATHYNSLYRTLQLLFKPLLTQINDIRVFKNLGYSAFMLYPSGPPKEFWNIRLFTTNEQYREVIYFTQNEDFLRKLQSDYINSFQYPSDFPGTLMFNASSCSLLMTSISKGLHFVDLLSLLIKEKIQRLDISSIPEIARVCPPIMPFLFAAYQPFLYLSPKVFLRLISAELPSINNAENHFCYKNNQISEKIIELQHRFINDFHLAKALIDVNIKVAGEPKEETKKSFFNKRKRAKSDVMGPDPYVHQRRVRRVSGLDRFAYDFSCPIIEIFKGHSIPFLFNGFYDSSGLLEFQKKKFFLFSDEETQNDFDFMFMFNALAATVALLISTRDAVLANRQKFFIDMIDENLSKIVDVSKLAKTSTDIFSLLFLEINSNEPPEYLCANAGIAYMIVRVLLKFFPSDRFITFAEISLAKPAMISSRIPNYSISNAFRSNLNFLLDIIATQNWSKAFEVVCLLCGNLKDKLDPRSKMYYRAYMLGLSVCKLMTEKFCSIDCQEFEDDLNLEISLSSSIYNTDDCLSYVLSKLENQPSSESKTNKIALIENIGKIRESRKKIEVDDILSPLFYSSWMEVESIVVNFEMFPLDFFSNKLFDRYKTSLEKSKSLFEFLSLVDVCFHSSNAKSLQFNPRSALINSFNIGRMEFAESLASMMKINLFEYALKHPSEFKFSRNSIEYYSEKYPLECIEICYRNKINYEKFSKYLPFITQDESQDQIESEFIKLITSAKNISEEFDDYLYRIDHSKISRIVVSNFDKMNKDVALYLLDVVDYAIEINKLNENIRKSILSKEIKRIISDETADNSQIAERLIDSDKFNLAANFINLNVESKEEKEKIVLQIVKRFLTSDNKSAELEIQRFISELENPSYFYELIVSKIEESVPLICNICDQQLKLDIEAFQSLPESVRTKSSLSDKSTIAEAICKEIPSDVIYGITKKHMNLLNEKGICLIINELVDNSSVSIQNYMNYSIHLSHLIDEKSKVALVNANSRRVSRELDLIKVDSVESEFDAFVLLTKIYKFNQVFQLDEKVSNSVNSFYHFLLKSPFFFTQIPYSFNGNSILNILVRLDLDEIANLFSKEFLDHFTYVKLKAKIMLDLGRFDDANQLLNDNKHFIYEMDENFLSPFCLKHFYNFDLLHSICNECSDFGKLFANSDDSELNSILTNLLNYKNFVSYCYEKETNSSSLLPLCSEFCERFSTKDSFYSFCIRNGEIKTVINGILKLDKNEDSDFDLKFSSHQLFINTIVKRSIEFNKIDQLKKEINDNRQSMMKLMNSLIDFCEKKNMGVLLSYLK